jgi:uncharacterized protein (TIGR02145 family)
MYAIFILYFSQIKHMYPWLLVSCIWVFSIWSCGSNSSPDEAVEERETATSPATIKSMLTIDGRIYKTIEVDGMIWLAENLGIETEDSWCYENRTENCDSAGRLYQWNVAKTVCESLGSGWYLPSDDDWKKLATHFGGYREWLDETDHGNPRKANAALIKGNESGFNALLNGWRGSGGGFDSKGRTGFYWSSTEQDEDRSIFYIFYPKNGKITRRSTQKSMGMSCRCVKKVK